MDKRIRVLLVDDSALARGLLRVVLENEPDFDIVGEARHGREAVDLARTLRPDLITMDLEMPVMGGLEAIETIMTSRAVPILVVSNEADAQNAYAAVARGALEVVPKPILGSPEQDDFVAKARLVAGVPVITHVRSLRLGTPPLPLPDSSSVTQGGALDALPGPPPAFVIASSTGGPQALARILSQLPPQFPCPVLIAQHIADGFAAGMADWLATISSVPVGLGGEGQRIQAGRVVIAPTECHLAVTPGRRLTLRPRGAQDVYRPSCDVLLESAATVFGRQCVGIILTGMGSDGARGLAAVRRAGGRTLAQNEATSVIFGMNRVAIEQGSVERVLPLDAIPAAMLQLAETLA
ncbi:chemotaxis-specific protein-glutamate methyltransferase CheB [Pararhodospirillum photometricum]|uniref:Protein-glutamate methylesterase/protein-glutamine glutaminase n=1 Tax=Pararhodospirillum photometricum DSM 122 TaxID=1150469 RepID=H6SRT0_PARPM|nr:chemotaxis-specific protein-glutamate methyltransferase CheB [Pararhodospirillum photometricum]CCG07609.1 Chemotaxis response regulator protein-glutamate methylesterase 5 [Pararhodospirillum photometricum DSM 122]